MTELAEYLPFGLTPDSLILMLAGLGAFIAVMAIWFTFMERDPLGPRMKALEQRREMMKAGIALPAGGNEMRKDKDKDKRIGMMKRVVDTLGGGKSEKDKEKRKKKALSLQEKLLRAGFRSKDATTVFMFFKFTMPFVVGIGAALALFVFDIYKTTEENKIMFSLLAFIIGMFLPELYVKNTTTKRQQLLRKALPDALDLMVICAEAGLSMDAAFTRVSREMEKGSPEMSSELALTAIELSFLPERRKALENLNQRTDMQEIRGVVNTMMQTEKYGTPLAHSLRVLSQEFRNDRLMKAEEKAARLPAILTVPMILFILPTLFVVLIGPAALRTIDALKDM